jgi:hypothetical protein
MANDDSKSGLRRSSKKDPTTTDLNIPYVNIVTVSCIAPHLYRALSIFVEGRTL